MLWALFHLRYRIRVSVAIWHCWAVVRCSVQSKVEDKNCVIKYSNCRAIVGIPYMYVCRTEGIQTFVRNWNLWKQKYKRNNRATIWKNLFDVEESYDYCKVLITKSMWISKCQIDALFSSSGLYSRYIKMYCAEHFAVCFYVLERPHFAIYLLM